VKVIDDHFCEMMHIDDDLANSKFAQPTESNFEQGLAGDFHQGLGAMVGKRPQPCAQPGGENHASHV
jgi:hypothetical protein